MTIFSRAVLTFALSLFALAAVARAQTATIEVANDTDKAQFSVQGPARRVSVEVFAPSGELVFEGEAVTGQSVEWGMVNQQGERVADGVYLATITVLDSAGKRRKRIEQVTVSRRPQQQAAASSSSPTPQAVGTITGEGTVGRLAKFDGPNSIANSIVSESAGRVGVNTGANTPSAVLQVNIAQQPLASAQNGTPASVLLQTSGGKGGNTTGTTGQVAGAGASISLLAGQGGNAPAGSIRGTGGSITLQPGGVGGGTGTGGASGNVLLAPTGVGNVGVGANSPSSKLTVAGGDILIQTAGRGVKFSDGTTQTTAALPAVQHDETLAGAGTSASPLSVADQGIGAAQLANGAVSGAKLSVPLTLSGNSAGTILSVTNTGSGAAFAADGNVAATGTIDTALHYKIQGLRVLSAEASHTFAGVDVGSTSTGTANSFFGNTAGRGNTEGANNSFFGDGAGRLNSTGGSNSFFGAGAGDFNTTGSSNTIIGAGADVGSAALTNATAVGARARVSQNNSLVLGSISGQNGATASANVGIGTTAPAARLHVRDNNGNILLGHAGCTTGFVGIGFGSSLSGCNNYALLSNGTDTMLNRPAGRVLFFREGNTTQMVLAAGGNLGIGTTSPGQKLEVSGGAVLSSGSGGGAFVANNPNNQAAALRLDWVNNTARIRYGGNGSGSENGFLIQGQGDVTKLRITDSGNVVAAGSIFSNGGVFLESLSRPANGSGTLLDLCAEDTSTADGIKIVQCNLSSIRYKTDVRSFTQGLSVVGRLRPVSFRWKEGGGTDFGLVAEEVATVAPVLATRNEEGEVDGVRYNRLGVVLINAVQEQQAQIEEQREQIKRQQAQIEGLKRLVCSDRPDAEVCRPEK